MANQVGRKKLLTPAQIDEAKRLKENGYSKVQLAIIYKVGATTIWENVFAKAKRIKKEREAKFRDLDTLLEIIYNLREEGYNSLQVSQKLDIPLAEVNYIYGHFN